MAFITQSLAFLGIDGTPVQVEVDVSQGLPGISIIGMGNKAVLEAIQRVRSALRHANLPLPPKKYTVNLAPADLPKDGAHYDLAIAVGLLGVTGAITAHQVDNALFFGEVSLNGDVKPGRHPVFAADTAILHCLKTIYGPYDERIRPYITDSVEYIPIASLTELFLHLKKVSLIPALTYVEPAEQIVSSGLSAIRGQEQAKRALTIALAGGHSILMIGSPGVGKSMLAHASHGLLPPLSREEARTSVKIHALASLARTLEREPPFRAPHHRITPVGLIGSARGIPGELSLAHNGILFLDELSEFRRDSLEALRQPLEDKYVRIGTGHKSTTLPADCVLIAATNPCPCGMYGDIGSCRCPDWARQRYQQRLSGALLDRFSIIIRLHQQEQSNDDQLLMLHRKQQLTDINLNNQTIMHQKIDNNRSYLNNASQSLLDAVVQSGGLSMRTKQSTIAVATTIARLDNSEEIQPSHIAEALQLRKANWHT